MKWRRRRLRKQISLPGKSKKAFKKFQQFLHPIRGRQQKITRENVDEKMPLFDEYQMTSLKKECEDVLIKMPLTVERLIQAEKFGLTSQLDRCAQEVARAASALVAGLGRKLMGWSWFSWSHPLQFRRRLLAKTQSRP